MKNNLFSGKSSRTKIFTVITAVLIILLLLLNVGITYFGIHNTAYVDMTPEGLYTLRPIMVDAVKDIFLNKDGTPKEQGIKITFCNDPDNLISSIYTRVVYYMCISLANHYPNLEIETVNVNYNPTAVAMYKNTSLSVIQPSDVIISYGDRYRIVPAKSFWQIDGSNEIYSFDGEYKLASIMMSLTLINQPAAYFVTDHGEDYYDSKNPNNPNNESVGAFVDLLSDCGFKIKTLSLKKIIEDAEKAGKTPEIYDDCALLIINNPKEDFRADPDKFTSMNYVSETELVDRFMTKGRGSVVVSKDYSVTLPNLEGFLKEWGMEFSGTRVLDTENCIVTEGEDLGSAIVGAYNTDENSYAYDIYGEYVDIPSAPRVVVTDTGHIKCSYQDSATVYESGTYNTMKIFAPFLFTSEGAVDYAKNELTGEYVDVASKESKKTIAAICGRQYLDGTTANNTNSYLFCAASADFFDTKNLGNSSYANFDVISSMIKSIGRTDTFASMELGGVSANNYKGFGGKVIVPTEMSTEESKVVEYTDDGRPHVVKINAGLAPYMQIVFTVIIALIPITIAVVGIVVCAKRKYL